MFIGNPMDKGLTAEVESNHGIATQRKISVRKKIMQGSELSAVAAAAQRVRLVTEKLSAPWLDGGLRIVASKSLIDAKLKIEKEIRDFEATVEGFLSARDSIIARDRVDLNGTFRESDYPSAHSLRSKFSARLEVLPLPTNDFRVEGIADSICAELAAEMESNTLARVTDAKRDLIGRIRERVATLASKLAAMNNESRFHASTLENVTEACAEVRAANFDEDQTINDLASKIETAVSSLSSDAIRETQTARVEAKEIATKALAEINEAMAGFMI